MTLLHHTAGAANGAQSLANVAPSNVLTCTHQRLLIELLSLKHVVSWCGIPQQPTASLRSEDENRGRSLSNHRSSLEADLEDVDDG